MCYNIKSEGSAILRIEYVTFFLRSVDLKINLVFSKKKITCTN